MMTARELALGVASVLAVAAFTLGVGVLAVFLGLAP